MATSEAATYSAWVSMVLWIVATNRLHGQVPRGRRPEPAWKELRGRSWKWASVPRVCYRNRGKDACDEEGPEA
jgi:hypothetical protein